LELCSRNNLHISASLASVVLYWLCWVRFLKASSLLMSNLYSVTSITHVPVPLWPLTGCIGQIFRKEERSQISSIDLLASPQVTTRVAAASKRRGNDPRQIGSGCCRTEKIWKGLAASLTPKKISCWFAAPREALFRRASIPMKARSPRHGASQRTRRALAAMLCYCLFITISKRETSMKDHINAWEVYLHSKRTSTNGNWTRPMLLSSRPRQWRVGPYTMRATLQERRLLLRGRPP